MKCNMMICIFFMLKCKKYLNVKKIFSLLKFFFTIGSNGCSVNLLLSHFILDNIDNHNEWQWPVFWLRYKKICFDKTKYFIKKLHKIKIKFKFDWKEKHCYIIATIQITITLYHHIIISTNQHKMWNISVKYDYYTMQVVSINNNHYNKKCTMQHIVTLLTITQWQWQW